MSEFSVRGGELKKLVTLARKKSLSFAFNPGKGPGDHMFGLDQRKAPDLVGRSVKKSGPGAKVAFGRCSVDGKLMNLVTEEPLPTMAKKLKAFLKLNGAPLNVLVMGPDGTVFESDVDDDDSDASGPDAAKPKPSADVPEASEQPEDDRPDPRDLVQRLKDMHPKAQVAPDPQRAKLAAALTQVAELIKGAKLAAAAGLLDKLDTALEGLARPAEDQNKKDDADPRLEKLRQAHARLGEAVAAIPDTALQGKLDQALKKIAQMLDAGNVEASTKGIKTVQAALQKADTSAGKSAAIPEPPPAPPVDMAALRGQLKYLASQIAASAGDDAPRRAALAGMAQNGNEALKAEDPEQAITYIAELREAMRPEPIDKPLTLPIWRNAKDDTNDQLGRLQEAMKNSGLSLFEKIADAGLHSATETRLVAMQVGLLELDAASDAAARSKAEQKLQTAMQDMRSFIDTSPILPLLDANPLKVPLKIRATLSDALDKIDRALAA
ncbi:hypothetical protein [Ruegeria jejuensis]|uniref:hypothetical protein n=1 Tax=Ruegeria jejuensis TaxID=3233338 RepID=UPI00355C0FD4